VYFQLFSHKKFIFVVMKSSIRTFLLISLLAMASFGGPLRAAELSAAQTAIKRGDYPKAVELLEPLAANGQPQAMYLLGTLYANGDGVEADDRKAVQLFRAAAAKGNKLAKQQIIAMFHSGTLVEPSPDDWHIQLGFVPSAQVGEREWRRLVKLYPDYLTGVAMGLIPSERGGKPIFLLHGVGLDEVVARAICADLAQTVQGCRVKKGVKPSTDLAVPDNDRSRSEPPAQTNPPQPN
jgi:hypothetical protein